MTWLWPVKWSAASARLGSCASVTSSSSCRPSTVSSRAGASASRVRGPSSAPSNEATCRWWSTTRSASATVWPNAEASTIPRRLLWVRAYRVSYRVFLCQTEPYLIHRPSTNGAVSPKFQSLGFPLFLDVLTVLRSLCSETPSVKRVHLASPMDHYASSHGDTGWGCGYRSVFFLGSTRFDGIRPGPLKELIRTRPTRNLQMLLSCLLRNDVYLRQLRRFCDWTDGDVGGPVRVPSITRLQSAIEDAWKMGFDTQVRSVFAYRSGKVQPRKRAIDDEVESSTGSRTVGRKVNQHLQVDRRHRSRRFAVQLLHSVTISTHTFHVSKSWKALYQERNIATLKTAQVALNCVPARSFRQPHPFSPMKVLEPSWLRPILFPPPQVSPSRLPPADVSGGDAPGDGRLGASVFRRPNGFQSAAVLPTPRPQPHHRRHRRGRPILPWIWLICLVRAK